jgi:hypothetical protein
VWSSAEEYIVKSMKGFAVGNPNEITFPGSTGIAIDLFRSKYHRFPLYFEKGKMSNA